MYVTRHVTSGRWRAGEVGYALVDELAACRRMIGESATRGDNVGLDEYVDERQLRLLLDASEIFVARSRDHRPAPQAFIVVQPCLLTRSLC